MVQLPATAAIEYVAACWVIGAGGFLSWGAFFPGVFCPEALLAGGLLAGGFLSGGAFVRGVFCPGGLLPGGNFVRGAYARSPQVQCVYEPSGLSVPTIVA